MANKKHAGGRPTKYKREYAERIIEYFSKPVVEEILTVTEGTGKSEWRKEEKRYEAMFFPTLELFAAEIGVCDDIFVEWAGAKDSRGRLKYPEFTDAYTRVKKIQKGLVIQYGMIGRLDSRFATFFASANLGMTPKSESEEHVTITTRKHKQV